MVIRMTDCHNGYIKNITVHGSNVAIEASESANIVIDNVKISECNTGIALSRSKNVTIERVSMSNESKVIYVGLFNFKLNYLSVIVYKSLAH